MSTDNTSAPQPQGSEGGMALPAVEQPSVEPAPQPTVQATAQQATAQQATAQQPTARQPAAQQGPQKARPRTSPIVWGALILVFCAYVSVQALGGSVDPTAWLITTMLGLGLLLLGVGVAVLVRGSRDRR